METNGGQTYLGTIFLYKQEHSRLVMMMILFGVNSMVPVTMKLVACFGVMNCWVHLVGNVGNKEGWGNVMATTLESITISHTATNATCKVIFYISSVVTNTHTVIISKTGTRRDYLIPLKAQEEAARHLSQQFPNNSVEKIELGTIAVECQHFFNLAISGTPS